MEEGNKKPAIQQVGQEQIHRLLFGEKLSWQAIIYDLINTEQLDPWNIDLSLLSSKYLEKIKELEVLNFFVSAKVLLAASFLLRIKTDILLDYNIKSLDDILFGKKEEKKYTQERIELDDEIPDLVPRTPLPRFKKVTLQELMSALGNAIKTETRRIRRVVIDRQREIEAAISIPKHFVNLHEKIGDVYSKLKEIFSGREEKLAFSELVGKNASLHEKIYTFVPLLHLDNQQKVWLEQNGHFDEIWILLKEIYEQQNAEALESMKREVEDEMKRLDVEMSAEEKERAKEVEENFANPLGGLEPGAESIEEDLKDERNNRWTVREEKSTADGDEE